MEEKGKVSEAVICYEKGNNCARLEIMQFVKLAFQHLLLINVWKSNCLLHN